MFEARNEDSNGVAVRLELPDTTDAAGRELAACLLESMADALRGRPGQRVGTPADDGGAVGFQGGVRRKGAEGASE